MIDASRKLASWWRDPVLFVREVFRVEPDEWQADVLRMFPDEPRIAMKASKGPGKTATLAWLCWNFLLTRHEPNIAATSITGDNLADGLWKEMAVWQNRSELLKAKFEWTKTRIFNRESPAAWWMSARTWPKHGDVNSQADTLAGLHKDYMMFVLDEVGGIPDAVMAAAEAGLSGIADGGGKEAHIVMAGNPTHLEGPLYRSVTTERHLWKVVEINSDPDNPKRSPRVSKVWAQQQIEKYGRDDPWVRVNVFGQFPPTSFTALVGQDDIDRSLRRTFDVEDLARHAVVMGVDVAREGGDKSAIVIRQGPAVHYLETFRGLNGLDGAQLVARLAEEKFVDAIFVDDTGGGGASWIDQLRVLNYQPIPVLFSGKPVSPRFLNKRAEMWFDMAQWVKHSGRVHENRELHEELITTNCGHLRDKFKIEDKDQIREKLKRSTDVSDALALTFACPIMPMNHSARVQMLGSGKTARQQYDPFARKEPDRLPLTARSR